nr:GNAT family N-acetyltransferase [uncultured Psychroserpens sp.]
MKNEINSSAFKIEQLNQNLSNSALLLLENIFYIEQNIPKELIPLVSDNQKWWCIKNKDEIVGIVAVWKINNEWHWGRLAIHEKLRGFGLGKKLVTKSLVEIFQMGIEKIIVDARDITVEMVLKMGGKITGKKSNFYGNSITPMEIYKKDFLLKS